MKLYVNAYSYNSRRCNALVRHIGADVSFEEVDLGTGQHQQPAFKALNPNAKVPVLVDGDLVLWESVAIMFYLAERCDSALRGTTPQETADIHRWCAWTLTRFNPASGVYLFENLIKAFFGLGDPDAERLAQTQPEIEACYAILEAQLAGRDYISEAGLSLADFTLYPTFEQAAHIHLPSWEQYPNLVAWSQRMGALPAFATP